MKTWQAFREGGKNIYARRRYVLVIYGLNLILALILGSFVATDIRASLGNSAAAETLREGFNDAWYRGFSAQAQGVSATFRPAVTGIGAVFEGLDALLQGEIFNHPGGIYWLGLLYWGMWVFFSAGFISLFGSDRGEFFRGAERLFLRFLLLAASAGMLYILIFTVLLPLLNSLVEQFTREMIDERPVFYYTLGKYALVWIPVLLIQLVLDYSKIAAMRHDVPLKQLQNAPLLALEFILRHPFRTLGLHLLLGIVWLLCLGCYWLIAPGAGQSYWITIMLVFLIGQIYIISRIALKGWFLASETALYGKGN